MINRAYRTIHHTTDSKGHSQTETVYRWQTNELEVACQVFSNETTLPQGTAQRFRFNPRSRHPHRQHAREIKSILVARPESGKAII
jgi:hypothetical protein